MIYKLGVDSLVVDSLIVVGFDFGCFAVAFGCSASVYEFEDLV